MQQIGGVKDGREIYSGSRERTGVGMSLCGEDVIWVRISALLRLCV